MQCTVTGKCQKLNLHFHLQTSPIASHMIHNKITCFHMYAVNIAVNCRLISMCSLSKIEAGHFYSFLQNSFNDRVIMTRSGLKLPPASAIMMPTGDHERPSQYMTRNYPEQVNLIPIKRRWCTAAGKTKLHDVARAHVIHRSPLSLQT